MKNDNEHQDKKNYFQYINIALVVIIIYMGLNKFSFIQNLGATLTGGNSLADSGLEYYFEKFPDQIGNEDVEAKVQNFGCHKEIYIIRDGSRVMRLSYSNGKIYELN